MAVAGAIGISLRLVLSIHIVWNGVGVGAELNSTKRDARSWKSMPHAVGPDDGIDVLEVVGDGFRLGGRGRLFAATNHR